MMHLRILFTAGVALACLDAGAARSAPVNFGPDRPIVESESVLTPRAAGGSPRVLYCPAETDQPGLRAEIAGWTGGPCDYVDPRVTLPSLAFLQTYDVVFTFPNFPFPDPVAWGNRLADYVDGGGRVILGAYSTFTPGNSIGGRIMDPDYCPVRSPSGTNHFAYAGYSGGGTSWIHRYDGYYQDVIRDYLVPQGQGIVDGRWNDGEILTAYRPDGRVMYLNGVGPAIGGSGDHERLVGNFAKWVQPGGVLYGSDSSGHVFVLSLRTGKGTPVVNLPNAGVGDIEYDHIGLMWVASSSAPELTAYWVYNWSANGPPVAQAGVYQAIEAIQTDFNLYGCRTTSPCGMSEIAYFNPLSGEVITGPVATGVGPVSGLAFNVPLMHMYYVTDPSGGCVPTSTLYSGGFGSAIGAPLTAVGPLGFAAGSLQFGPDDNLYAGSLDTPSKLYRINPTNGATTLIGATGFGPLTGLTLVDGANAVDAGPLARESFTSTLALSPALPNPSHAGTSVVLRYATTRVGRATIALYDVAGRRVWTHTEAALDAGDHTMTWDGRDGDGSIARAGIYVVKLETAQGEKSAKLLRL